MGANRRPDGHEERDEPEPIGFVRLVEISVQQGVCQLLLVPVPQIHQQEGQVVQHVDGREVLVEFKTVEQGRGAMPQADVAKDEVAMAAPDLA